MSEETLTKNAANIQQTTTNGNNGDADQILHEEVLESLKKQAKKLGLDTCKLTVTSGSEKGDNYLGIIAKTTVTGTKKNGDTVKWNWIVKSAPKSEILRQMLQIDLVYGREVYMYRLFERFTQFQEERSILKPFNSYPKFIMSYLEPYKESFAMEDMKSIGYIMRNRKEPLDVNHVKLIMMEYGKFHAISFALRDQSPQEFQKISEETIEQFFMGQETRLEDFSKHFQRIANKLLDVLKDENDENLVKNVKKYTDNAIPLILKSLKATSKYSVVGHGDSWVNNMLWKYDNPKTPNVPTNVCILDWQLARYGSPAYDLSYFIYACTDKEFRDKHYEQMIKLYYYSLCKHLSEMGSDPQKLFPYTALEGELRRHSIFGFHMSCMVLQLIMSEKDEIPDWENSTNIEEMMKTMNYETVNRQVLNERLRGVMQHMHGMGYFDFLNN